MKEREKYHVYDCNFSTATENLFTGIIKEFSLFFALPSRQFKMCEHKWSDAEHALSIYDLFHSKTINCQVTSVAAPSHSIFVFWKSSFWS